MDTHSSHSKLSNQGTVYTPPDRSEWPNAPVLVTQPKADNEGYPREVISIHKPGPNEISELPIDTNLFVGKMYVVIRGLDKTPESFFTGKRRLFNVIVQGRFKKPDIPFHSAVTGQIFASSLHLIPPATMLAPFKLVMDRLQPSLRMDLNAKRPYAVSPLMSTMQTIG
jgi:hypothetical protein